MSDTRDMWRIILPILIVTLPTAALGGESDPKPPAAHEFTHTLAYGSGWEKIRALSVDQARKLSRSAGFALNHENIRAFRNSYSSAYRDISLEDVPNQLPLVALETLTVDQARELSNFGGNGILLWSLNKLDVEPARELARYRGDWIQAELDLSGLEKLRPDVAGALAGFRGARLKLNGLSKLERSGAAQLASYRGDELHLDGLRTISFKSLRALTQFKGNLLSLNGLRDITTLHARALAKFTGNTIRLDGINSLDDSETRELLNFEGQRVDLSGVTYLSDEQAVMLSQAGWNTLNLNGLIELNEVQAHALAEFGGRTLALNGMTVISDTLLRQLVKFSGERLELKGMKAVTQEQARILGRFAGRDLYLSGIGRIGNDSVDEFLRARTSMVWLNARTYVFQHNFTPLAESGKIGLMFDDLAALTRSPVSFILDWRGGLALTAHGRLTDFQLKALCSWPGHTLDLAGLKALSPNQANILALASCAELRLGGLYLVDEKDIETLAASTIPRIDISGWSNRTQISFMQFKYDREMGDF